MLTGVLVHQQRKSLISDTHLCVQKHSSRFADLDATCSALVFIGSNLNEVGAANPADLVLLRVPSLANKQAIAWLARIL